MGANDEETTHATPTTAAERSDDDELSAKSGSSPFGAPDRRGVSRATGDPAPDATGATKGRGPFPDRDPLDFELDDAVIRRLTGRDTTRLRRLTAVRAPRRDGLDAEVLGVLDALDAKYRAREQKMDARRILSTRYLNEAEAVTRSLNSQSLPKTTRLLLAVDGLYETLLLQAIRSGVGATVEGDVHVHTGSHGGESDLTAQDADLDR
jgi:hypothetical protein